MSGSCHLDRASVIIIRTSYVCQVVLTKTVFKTPCKKWFPQQESFRVKFSNIYFPLQIFRTLSVHSTRSKIKEFAYTSIKHTMRKKNCSQCSYLLIEQTTLGCLREPWMNTFRRIKKKEHCRCTWWLFICFCIYLVDAF